MFVWMVDGGVPAGSSAEVGVTTTITKSEKSGCPVTCKKPQTTESKVVTTTQPPLNNAGEGALDRAFDNDAGVTLLRLIAALLTAYLTAVIVRRLLLGLIDPHGEDGGGARAAVDRTPPENSSGGEETKPQSEDLVAEHAEKLAEVERRHSRHTSIQGVSQEPAAAEDTLDA
jgi:hypothetical protein